MNKTYTYILIILVLFVFGIVSRFFPHIPNMTPITAVAFASSLYLGKRWAIILPLGILAVSDSIIGFYDWRMMIVVYASFCIIGCISWICRTYKHTLTLFWTVAGTSFLFFLTTNTAVWLFSPWYEKNIHGLLYAYELGIPFLRNMFIGDLVYLALILGVFELIKVARTTDIFGTKQSVNIKHAFLHSTLK